MGIDNVCGLSFRGITRNDLLLLEKWYGMSDYFGYATGFRDFSDIRQRLLEPVRPNRLTSMICAGPDGQTVGFIYGEVKSIEMKTVLWIHIIIIEPVFQHKGLGTRAVNKLIRFVNSQYGPLTCIVSVSNRNKHGLSFWEKAGFSHSVDMEESLQQSGSSDVSILKRIIK